MYDNRQIGLLDWLGSDQAQNIGGLLGGAADIGTGLFSIWGGNKLLGMYEDQLDMNKDKWAQSKQELEHLRKTRSRLNASYMA